MGVREICFVDGDSRWECGPALCAGYHADGKVGGLGEAIEDDGPDAPARLGVLVFIGISGGGAYADECDVFVCHFGWREL